MYLGHISHHGHSGPVHTMWVWLENGITNLVAAWFIHGLTSVYTMPARNRFCWPHLRLLTNDDTTLFQPCPTVKLAWMSHRHETPYFHWMFTQRQERFCFRFIPTCIPFLISYRLKQVPRLHRVNERPIRNDFVPFSNHVYRHRVNGASVDVCCYFKIRLIQDKGSLAIQFIFCTHPPTPTHTYIEKYVGKQVLGISIWFWKITFTYGKGN